MSVIVTSPSAGFPPRKTDSFIVTNPTIKSFNLTYMPIEDTEDVIWNGIEIHRIDSESTHDYTMNGNVVTLDPLHLLTIGDEIIIKYYY